MKTKWTRRTTVKAGLSGMGLLATGPVLSSCRQAKALDGPKVSNIANLGPLLEPDDNDLRLPEGFTSRTVARSGDPVVEGSDFVWHEAPDGGAVFATEEGGWIYVSNAELDDADGGVSAIVFDKNGEIIDAYPILSGSYRNCAGGPTPWNTWLSCEEVERGIVWECDPFGVNKAIERRALGVFNHEAAAYDPIQKKIYLTEDEPEGRFYRFTADNVQPDGYPDLSSGALEVMEINAGLEGAVTWHEVPDPAAETMQTKDQVPEATIFDGGEGIWQHDGMIYFATKGDNRVWAYDVAADTISIIYDKADHAEPVLAGVDNLTVFETGDVFVAEDTLLEDTPDQEQQIVAITRSGLIVPVVQLVGHVFSEIAGPAFSPHGDRLYFSSQRGAKGANNDGVTYEVTGPFFLPE